MTWHLIPVMRITMYIIPYGHHKTYHIYHICTKRTRIEVNVAISYIYFAGNLQVINYSNNF